ncbi:MAG: hypothetical protein ABEJ42_08160 [Halobacteriaceae archaeon]
MEAIPVDALPVWVALSVVAAIGATAAVAVPNAPPPDARTVAEAVDRVAASSVPGVATVPVRADAVRVGPHRVALRSDGGRASAAFAYGPVTPARDGRLGDLLAGVPPSERFDSPSSLAAAARSARAATPRWADAGPRVTVRRVTWGGVHVTLVGV